MEEVMKSVNLVGTGKSREYLKALDSKAEMYAEILLTASATVVALVMILVARDHPEIWAAGRPAGGADIVFGMGIVVLAFILLPWNRHVRTVADQVWAFLFSGRNRGLDYEAIAAVIDLLRNEQWPQIGFKHVASGVLMGLDDEACGLRPSGLAYDVLIMSSYRAQCRRLLHERLAASRATG